MAKWVSAQRRTLHINKDGRRINEVTFQRGRNKPNQKFRLWTVIHSIPGKFLPFFWHDQLDVMKKCLEEGGYTWEWQPVENIWEE